MFDVRTFGATGDGKTVDSPAINAAIEAAAAAGGGTVVLSRRELYLVLDPAEEQGKPVSVARVGNYCGGLAQTGRDDGVHGWDVRRG